MDTAELLQRLRAGDNLAARELVTSYHPELYRLALSLLDDPAEAADLTQEVFIAALGALDSYRGEAAFKTWLFSITVNLCRRRWRQRQARERLNRVLQSIFPFNSAPPPAPEEALLRGEERAELWQAVAALGERYRPLLILFYEHELPVAEIARILELPVGTVLSRLHTARERLAATLRSRPGAEPQAGTHAPDLP